MRAMRIMRGGSSTAGRSPHAPHRLERCTDSGAAWVVSTIGTPPASSTGFCRKLSIETPRLGQRLGHRGDHARLVRDQQAHVGAADLACWRRPAAKGFSRPPAAWNTGRARAGHHVGDVGGDGRGGRPRAGARALDEDAADPRALDEERVERAAGLRQRMAERRQRRVHAAPRRPSADSRGAGDQLDAVAEVLGQADVEQLDLLDALDLGGGEVGRAAERQRRQDGDLVRRRRSRRRPWSGRPRRSPGAGPRRARRRRRGRSPPSRSGCSCRCR